MNHNNMQNHRHHYQQKTTETIPKQQGNRKLRPGEVLEDKKVRNFASTTRKNSKFIELIAHKSNIYLNSRFIH